MKNDTAYLSNNKDCISFRYGNRNIRFKGPYSLDRIDNVKEWDNGYIVVMAHYHNQDGLIEDYIDLPSILRNLYVDPDDFLKNIKRVEVIKTDDTL